MPKNKSQPISLSFSIIIAVYERQDELRELLHSLVKQTCTEFEVVVVDDGSQNPLKFIVEEFTHQLDIQYYYKPNSGPGLSRNYGMSKAKGNYFIFLDSDTILPTDYMCTVQRELTQDFVDFFGGSDSAHNSFNNLQKAINFSMTSTLTTGGIRGGKKKVGKFQPRSFNMGISKKAYATTGGFSTMRVGEDPDLTMTLWEHGFKSRWIPGATVYHKRRATFSSYARQVKSFGVARPILNKFHPNYTSITFWFPSLFTLGLISSIILALIGCYFPLYFYALYFISIFTLASIQYKSITAGLLAVITTTIQFLYYGYGFLLAQIKLNFLQQNPKEAFPNHFYQTI